MTNFVQDDDEKLWKCQSFSPDIGAKHDSGKLQFGCLTVGLAKALKGVAEVLTYGAKKYARDSWQQVPNARERYRDAMDRHLNERSLGNLYDEESKLPHMAHVACNALFLLYFEIIDMEKK